MIPNFNFVQKNDSTNIIFTVHFHKMSRNFKMHKISFYIHIRLLTHNYDTAEKKLC